MDKGLNELLKWSIENASTTANDPSAAPPTNRGLNSDALAALMGGPSDADLMKASMAVITAPAADAPLDDRLVAFDNFEQLVESLDNANLLGPLALWTPLLAQLDSAEPDLRRMAAWCIGTAVQNNQPSQESLLALGGVARLVRLATAADETPAVRRKAFYALSSAVRNYQPAMDACMAALAQGPAKTRTAHGHVDATDMNSVDKVIDELKALHSEESAKS